MASLRFLYRPCRGGILACVVRPVAALTRSPPATLIRRLRRLLSASPSPAWPARLEESSALGGDGVRAIAEPPIGRLHAAEHSGDAEILVDVGPVDAGWPEDNISPLLGGDF